MRQMMYFDDNPDVYIPVTQKYKLLDTVKLNGVAYEVFNIVYDEKVIRYQCTRKHQ